MKKNENDDLNRSKPKYPDRELAFTVPVAPSVNHMYIPTKSGSKVLTKEAKAYIRIAQDIARDAIKKAKWKKDEDHVWYYMDLYFYFPDKRIRDSHNCIKLLMDCFEGLLFPNDYYVMPRIQRVELDKENPKIDVIFSPQGE